MDLACLGRLGATWLFSVSSACFQAGFQPISLMLIDDGVFRWRCDGEDGCSAQEEAVGMLLLTANSAECLWSLPAGLLSDRFGPKILLAAWLPMIALAYAGLYFSNENVQLYHMTFALLGMGTATLTICLSVWARLYPRIGKTWFSLMVAAVGANTGVAPLLRIIKKKVGWSLASLLLVYLGLVQVPLWSAATAVMPRRQEIYTRCLAPRTFSSNGSVVSCHSVVTASGHVTYRNIQKRDREEQNSRYGFLRTLRFWTYTSYFCGTLWGINYLTSAYLVLTSPQAANLYGYIFISLAVVAPLLGLLNRAAPFWSIQLLCSASVIAALAPLYANKFVWDVVAGAVSIISISLIWPSRLEFALEYFGFEVFGRVIGCLSIAAGLIVQLNHISAFTTADTWITVTLSVQALAALTIPLLEHDRRKLLPSIDNLSTVTLDSIGLSNACMISGFIGPLEPEEWSVGDSELGPMLIQLPHGDSAHELDFEALSDEEC